MSFCSYEYLIFLPAVFIVYCCLPEKCDKIWLLISSLFFYACWNVKYLCLIIFSILITYFASAMIQRLRDCNEEKETLKITILIICIVSNLLILFVFKYFNFLACTVNQIIKHEAIPLLDVLLPVGISFYTFQAIGYTVDVYRGEIKAEKNIFVYALFVCFFPQLVAGPIERTSHLLPQLKKRFIFDYDEMKKGLILIGYGFFTKLVIADRISPFVDIVYKSPQTQSGIALIYATLLFTIQIYCDFLSYSNIARGTAQIFGINLMKNFDAPYYSQSISEFWRKWHISLSSWLRDYIYIPLGGNRAGLRKYCINILLTFLISGLWHGANWTFVIWGLLHGLYSITERLLQKKHTKGSEQTNSDSTATKYNMLKVLLTFALVNFSNIFFRSSSVREAITVIVRIITFASAGDNSVTLINDSLNLVNTITAIAAVFILAVIDYITAVKKIDIRDSICSKPLVYQWLIYLALIITVSVFGIYGPAYDSAPFIYFQF